jgi:hypothetical protein
MIARVKVGAAGTHVGQEVDGQVTCVLSPQLRIVGGLAHIFPGGFLETATSGSPFTCPFVGATYTFATSF